MGSALALLATSRVVSASGFALPELSAAGLGLSNAIVANPENPGAIPYNPAAMGFHDHSSLDVGMLLINPNFEVKTATGTHESTGANWIAAPLLQGVWKIDSNWGLGLGVNAPFGLETKWEVGTFPKLSVPIPIAPGVALPAGLQHPTQSKLEIVSVVPSVAYRVNDSLSLAAGADYYHARTGILDTGVIDVSGDGNAWGWNISALFREGPWSFGVSYHSSATVGLSGDLDVSDPVLIALGRRSQSVDLDLDLPWRLQIGARYAFNNQLAAEFDLSRTGWSQFNKIKVKSKSGAIITEDTNDWDDANAYRFGVTYQIQPNTQLRLGYTYDKTGQSDAHFSARVPDDDRHLFSIGLGHNYDNSWSVEAGYMYVMFEDRNYRSSKPYVPLQDINGTSAINGDYKAHANLFGLNVRKTF
jgi:long-chain fatty acid transport protein